MSKLSQLSQRLGDLVARRVELRFRVAGGVKSDTQGNLALAAANEIATLSEQIGQLQMAMADEQGRMAAERRRSEVGDQRSEVGGRRSEDGEPVDLRMASGVPTCVECHEVRSLDENGRCGVCSMCVAGATA